MAGTTLNGAKWSSRAQAAAPDYNTGVSSTTKDWAGITAAAEGTWKQGVTDAFGRGAFGKGVKKAGSAKWQSKAADIGSTRYGQGVAAAQASYESGFGPYAAKLDSIKGSYPARGPRGSPANINRVSAVATALHTLKTQGT